MVLADPVRLDLRYSQTMIAALAFGEPPKDVLLMGLGGASVPKFIQKHWPDVRLDIVEIDPDVVKVCQKYFKFEGTPNTRVFVMDGRLYLKRTERKYDVILLDAYAADHIPFHLTTIEFVRRVKERLKPGGLVASNLWERAVNRFYYAELKTFQETFPQTYLFAAGSSGNILVFGAMRPERVSAAEWAGRAKALAGPRDLGFDLAALVGREYRVLTDQAINEAPLTDDMAPVNTLRHEHPRYFEGEATGKP
jgi:spermidine synthase